MPPPPSAASFEIHLPDGRVGRNPPAEDGPEEGNEWEIDITAGTATEFAVTVDIYPEVVLETLLFRITSVNGAEVWSVNAGESLSEGRHQVVVAWDGLTREGDPVLGRHHLSASATIERDYRNACYGDQPGVHEGWGLGYLDVVSP